MATKASSTTTRKSGKTRRRAGAGTAWSNLSPTQQLTELAQLKESLQKGDSALKATQMKRILTEAALTKYKQDCKDAKSKAAKGATAKLHKRYEGAKSSLDSAVAEYLNTIEALMTNDETKEQSESFADVTKKLKSLTVPALPNKGRTTRDEQMDLIQKMYAQLLKSELEQQNNQLMKGA